MAVKKWPRLGSEIVGDYRIFRLRRDRAHSPHDGREFQFYVLEAPDWINVIPLTPEGKVVLIRQYRHGTEEISLEIPGGMVDEEDGSPAATARRELLEETGYAAEEVIPIGRVAPNPAFLDNCCHTFLARNARPIAEPQFDGAEYIELELVDLDEIPALITGGRITHALVVAAFYYYEQFRRRR